MYAKTKKALSISVEQLDVSDECNSLFDVEDVEKGLNSLKFNKAGAIDGLTIECISSSCFSSLEITVQCDLLT